MVKLVKRKYITSLEWGVKISYLLLAFATFNSFMYSSSIQPALVKICLVFGGLTLFGRICFFKDYIKTPYWVVLVLFCISFLVSIFVNRSYGGVSGDLRWLVWTGFLFALLYVSDSSRSVKSYKKEFNWMSHIMIVYGTIAGAAGIYMMFSLYQKLWFTGMNEKMMVGFWWGRLWGVYTDPNYGGVFSVVVILLSLYFIRSVRSWRKIFYVPVIVVNFLYMVFSDSRTAEICLAAAVGWWILYTTVFKFHMMKGALAGLLIAAVFTGVFFTGTSFLKEKCNAEIQKQINVLNAKKEVKKNTSIAARKAELDKDVTNGRLGLWESGIEVWKTSPVFGTGYNSFVPYARQNVPKTYAINNSEGNYVSLHNNYINVLVYQGAVGAVLLLAFMALVLRRFYKGVRKIEIEDRDYIAVLSASILVVAISMLFLLEGFYTISPGSFILWAFLGYMMHYFTINKKAET